MKNKFKKILLQMVPAIFYHLLLRLWLFVKQPKLLLLYFSNFKTLGQPILIISTPRSGSSWLGGTLGAASTARYLREPITTNYMQTFKGLASFFSIDKCNDWLRYSQYAKNAFAPKLRFSKSVIPYPAQWFDNKSPKKTVIKEVNPLVLSYYLAEYSPRVIYLIREPYAVAKSADALGWINPDIFSKRFTPQELNNILVKQPNLLQQDYWFQSGYLQGIIESRTLTILKKYPSSLVVHYEQLCHSPLEEFEKIFNFAELPFEESIKQKITHSLAGNEQVDIGDFSLIRNINYVGKKHIAESEKENYNRLMSAYSLALQQL